MSGPPALLANVRAAMGACARLLIVEVLLGGAVSARPRSAHRSDWPRCPIGGAQNAPYRRNLTVDAKWCSLEGENVEDAFGLSGRATVPIPADGPGEVGLRIRGGTEAFTAFSEDGPIGKGTLVVVVECPTARSVIVKPF